MRIVTVEFDYRGESDYKRLAEVFKYSCQKVMPTARYDEIVLQPPADVGQESRRSFISNSLKLAEWVRQCRQLEETKEPLIFADCDMLANADAEEAFRLYEFDVAYTVRKGDGVPMNGGILFVRPSAKVTAFFERWLQVNDQMMEDSNFHQVWRRRWAGINQAAFGYMHENEMESFGIKFLELPCERWNSCNSEWRKIDGYTVFIHIKSELRRMVLRHEAPKLHYITAMNLWYEAQREMEAQNGTTTKRKYQIT